VYDIGEDHREDHAYFAAIDEEGANGGYEALLYHLLNEVDCSKVNLRSIPQTAALLEQKVASMTAEQAWWLDVLRSGVLPGDKDGEGVSARDWMYADYIKHARDRGVSRRVSETALGMFLAKYAPPTRDFRPTPTATRARVFPPLADCREFFAAKLRTEGKAEGLGWGEAEEWSGDSTAPGAEF
jgi:hypothetical protein